MKRCLHLAQKGKGRVSPNPLVGSVIVYNNRVIGEGYHRDYGGPHAEVNAVRSVKDRSLLTRATIYVSLEPCCHFGKTPPCTDLILDMGIPRVVICNTDPNPQVHGGGIGKLKENGVEVITGVLEQEGRRINRIYFKSVEIGLPYITLKWAVTANGIMGRQATTVKTRKISNAYSDKLVHKLRSEYDAILIGSRTMVQDDPLLTNRLWPGKSPLRLVLGSVPDISAYQVGSAPPETRVLDPGKNGGLIHVLQELNAGGIRSVLVEGGPKVLESFIAEGIWDEAIMIKSPIVWESGISAPQLEQQPYRYKQVGSDRWHYYKKQE